jgi:predicted DNA-binding transcriptional regulator AlpA
MRSKKEKVFIHREYLRVRQIVNECGIGMSTAWLYAKQGKITPIKLSERVTVFSIDELNKVFNLDIKKEIEKTKVSK